MSRVSYFQRFSQPENHATNNTLLALRYLYEASPFKLQGLLNSLLDTELSIGLAFEQQIRGQFSVPDAGISQEPLRIFIETKLGGDLDATQIRAHFNTVASHPAVRGGSQAIMVGLTKDPISESDRQSLAGEAASKGIRFGAVTFSDVLNALNEQCSGLERELQPIVEDFRNYLADSDLLEGRNKWLVVFACGTSFEENVRFKLYYEPPSRPCKRNYRFIGVYHNKMITHVGSVEAIAIATCASSGIEYLEEAGLLTDDHRKRIAAAIEQTKYYDLRDGANRFYLVDTFAPTGVEKISLRGRVSIRYLDLATLLKSFDARRIYSSIELAEALKGCKWE